MPIDSSTENMYIKGLWQKKTGKCGNVSQVGTLPTPPKKVKKGKVEMGLTNPPTPISIKFTHFPVFSFCKWDRGYRGYLAGEKGLKLLLLLR